MLHLHLVAFTEKSVQVYFGLGFSSQLWCSFHITACNYTSKEGLEGLRAEEGWLLQFLLQRQ